LRESARGSVCGRRALPGGKAREPRARTKECKYS